jgi:hypothetical protein
LFRNKSTGGQCFFNFKYTDIRAATVDLCSQEDRKEIFRNVRTTVFNDEKNSIINIHFLTQSRGSECALFKFKSDYRSTTEQT